MFPTLLKIGGFELSTYGVLMACGYLAAIYWLQSRQAEMGLNEDDFWSLIYWLFGGALVGGKIGYAIVERDLSLLWHNLRFGFVFYGGFFGAIIAGLILSKRKSFDLVRLSDYFGVALPIGHASGRFGCLAAGCCYGSHTDMPWGINLAGDPSRHPTQIYESLANFLIALIVWKFGLSQVRRGRLKPGSAFFLYIVLYAIVRFVIEIFRADDRGPFIGGLSPSQLLSIILIVVIGIVSWKRKQ